MVSTQVDASRGDLEVSVVFPKHSTPAPWEIRSHRFSQQEHRWQKKHIFKFSPSCLPARQSR